jgi:hypothetical protein
MTEDQETFTLTSADIRKLGRRAARTVLRELALSSDRNVVATVRRWAMINLPRSPLSPDITLSAFIRTRMGIRGGLSPVVMMRCSRVAIRFNITLSTGR